MSSVPNSVLDFVSGTVLPALRMGSSQSGTTTTTPAWPRTDLKDITNWTSFNDVVRANRPILASIPFQTSLVVPRSWIVQETNIHSFADSVLHSTLESILEALGHANHRIEDIGGKAIVVGDPDRVFLCLPNHKPMATIEFKTPWSFSRVADLPEAFKKAGRTSKLRRAIYQTYGYMTFNDNRFGVLTTYDDTYFFQRSYSQAGGSLQVAGPFTYNNAAPFTVLEAYTTFLLLCTQRWFYVSPTVSPSPSRPGSSDTTPQASRPSTPSSIYTLIDVEVGAVKFEQGCDRSRVGAVVRGTYKGSKVVFKIVDDTKHVEFSQELDIEALRYRDLASLQGEYIPRFLGYIRIWGMLKVLVLEDCGTSVADCVNPSNVDYMNAGCLNCLWALHEAGFVHGDVRLANFVFSDKSKHYVLDFGQSRPMDAAGEEEDKQALSSAFSELEFT